MLIPRPKSLGINIDMYLQPLVDELKMFWSKDRGEPWDAKDNHNFKMKHCYMGHRHFFATKHKR
jgi:uncharacterized protein YigE (DUF2233 family)